MSKLLIVANRLPVTVERRKGEHRFKRSVGGVATGLDSCRRSGETLWIGWAETPSTRIDAAERERLREELRSGFDSEPVFLTQDDVAGFYHGFSNRTLWPLFHYFERFAEFNPEFWRAYERVNRKYRDAVLEAYTPGDRIWVHDYQLMLLPGMLRARLPDAPIGFFLHIPFPSYELYRLLPWRREVLEGMLGANLIGFHTHDYVRHFLASVHSLLGIEDRNGVLRLGDRLALADAFPMGIDYDRYAEGVRGPAVQREKQRLGLGMRKQKLVLSIDRLDYSKGIPERLRSFDRFLEQHPEWRGKVTLLCVAVPSRSRVWRYRELKREVDELVGDINGRWATLDWTPVRYLYRSLPFNTLLAVYAAADVALVTPLRDGMNLIAKEYVAAHSGEPGVLVLSEVAGAARELSDAIIVNPQDEEAVVAALAAALEMPADEQVAHNRAMERRLRRYDVIAWTNDFLARLDEVMMRQLAFGEFELTDEARSRLLDAFAAADERLLLLDYDGTLVPFAPTPEAAAPDAQLVGLLRSLAEDEHTTVVLISGRDRQTLETWFGELPVSLVAEHGAWVCDAGSGWATAARMSDEWKAHIRPVIDCYTDRTPGSFAEEKDFSIAWHYRQVPGDLWRRRLQELTESLAPMLQSLGLSMLDGDHVLEVKPAGIDKGSAAHRWSAMSSYGFIFAVGDDVTDEDIFAQAPPTAWTVKVGKGPTAATFDVDGPQQVRELLAEMLERAEKQAPVPLALTAPLLH